MSERRLVLRRAASDGAYGTAAVFLLLALLLVGRAWWEPRVAAGQLVEVRGAVARPGLHRVEPATLRAAVEAAGGLARELPDTPLRPGEAVDVGPGGARVVRADRPLLVGEPLELDRDGVAALSGVRGVTPGVAVALVGLEGPPRREEVQRAAPRRTAERVLSVAKAVGPSRLDLNRADAAALERLPGIGPSLAARIVADREKNGPFRSVEELDRVSGIGPATVAKLAGSVTVGGGLFP